MGERCGKEEAAQTDKLWLDCPDCQNDSHIFPHLRSPILAAIQDLPYCKGEREHDKLTVQGDHSLRSKPLFDIKTKGLF